MSSAFPTGLDPLVQPGSPNDAQNAPVSHFGMHGEAADAIRAIQTKLGIDNSLDSTSIDWLIRNGVKWVDVTDPRFGADPTGVADSTAAIQAALDYVGNTGTWVFFPAGTFKVTPPVHGNAILFRYSNVRMLGQGKHVSIIKVANGVGSYLALFRHYNNSVDLTGIVIEELTFDQNETGNPTPSLVDVEAYPRLILLVPRTHDARVRNCRFIDCKNVNTLEINTFMPSGTMFIENNYFSMNATSTIDNDHSTIYATGTNLHICNNEFVCSTPGVPGVRTALETHASNQVVIGNNIVNFLAGMNITGVSTDPDSNMVVIGNNIAGCLDGILLWSYFYALNTSSPALTVCNISHNNIKIDRDPYSNVNAIALPLASGISMETIGTSPAKMVQITHNNIFFKITAIGHASDNTSAGIHYRRNSSVVDEDLSICSNIIENAICMGVRVTADVRRALICDNMIYNCGRSLSSAFPNAYRVGIFCSPFAILEDWLVSRNIIVDNQSTAQMRGGAFAHFDATAVNCQFVDNIVRIVDATVPVIVGSNTTAAAWFIRLVLDSYVSGNRMTTKARVGSNILDSSTGNRYVQQTAPAGTNFVVDAAGASSVISTGSTVSRTLADRFADIVNVADFGAVADGSTDNAAAFQAAFNSFSAAVGGILLIKAGVSNYRVTSGCTISSKSNIMIISDGAEIKYGDAQPDALYNTWPDLGKDSILRFVNCTNISITGLILNGNIQHRTAYVGQESFNSCLLIASSSQVTLKECTFKNRMTDGITVQRGSSTGAVCTNISIRDCIIDSCRRNGVSLVDQFGVLMDNCTITNTGASQGTAPMSAIDIEPDYSSGRRSQHVTIRKCFIDGSRGSNAISVGGLGSDDVVIENCTVLVSANCGINVSANGSNLNTDVRLIDNLIIPSSTLTGTLTQGIRVVGQQVDLIRGNTIRGMPYGIRAFSSNGLAIDHNLFVGNGFPIAADDSGFPCIRLHCRGNRFVDNVLSVGGGNYALSVYPASATALVEFDNNTVLNSEGALSKADGARLVGPYAICRSIGRNNTGSNLLNPTAIVDANFVTVPNNVTY